MAFWIPHAENSEQAERVYEAIRKNVGGKSLAIEDRIEKLSWEHNGEQMCCEVGKALDPYYRTGDEQVIAIIDCGDLYKVCTASRGVIQGDGIFAGKGFGTIAVKFE